jgi:predicted AlkP superfamily pyrophosphatase or phosphodiesterase
MHSLRYCLLAGAAAIGLATVAQAEERNHDRSKHVLLISVDGMHEVDLRLWIKNHPSGPLAELAERGKTYSQAYTTAPSDSFPGMLAQATGGTSYSTGVFYDDSYDRALFAPGSNCQGAPGTETQFAETIDKSLADVTGGGILGQPITQIDPAQLPLALTAAGCAPVYPHMFNRVNTIFEVLHSHGRYTAWSDKHPAYEILTGPSGKGIDDLYTPEINSQLPGAPSGTDNTTSFAGVRNYDSLKVNAILSQIDGWDSTHTARRPVPAIFGMNFQSVSVGQKLAASGYGDAPNLTGGYLDAAGTPGAALTLQFNFIDDSVGKMVNELKSQGLFDKTVIIISAKHGQSPIDLKLRRAVKDAYSTLITHGFAFDIADDAALVWLDPATQKQNYQAALADMKSNAAALGIDHILTRDDLKKHYRDPFTDSRTPDFYVVSQHGVIYTGGSKLAEHGGVADDDRHVALLVSARDLEGETVDAPVATTQIAPTILRTLGYDPEELQAVRIEGVHALPGLFD